MLRVGTLAMALELGGEAASAQVLLAPQTCPGYASV